MSKLIIQIPCYNEEKTLPTTLNCLPRKIEGISQVEWLVIDDGSHDRTSEVAKECGVDRVVRHPTNRGLAKTFLLGLETAIGMGADIIVNTDADNQYQADDIPKLIRPILEGKAEIVIGARPIEETKSFSKTKKILQRVGSLVVRVASQTTVEDAPSGFRAYSRDAARQMNVFNEYTYTLETIIQAGQKGMSIFSVPIRTNEVTRPSRLVRSNFDYILRSMFIILRIFVAYKPFKVFLALGSLFFLSGVGVGLRFMYYYLQGAGQGHVQSLILAAILLLIGSQVMLLALLADIISINRRLLEKVNWRIQKISE